MKITINNILTEAIIDDMTSLSKMDKAILKFLHREKNKPPENNYWENQDAHKVWDLIKTFGLTDGDYIFKMWNLYKNYGKILFDDISIYEKYDTSDYDEAADVILLKYYFNNIIGEMVYPGWIIDTDEGLESMLSENDMTIEVRHMKYSPIMFCGMSLDTISEPENKIGMELLSYDDDLGTYLTEKGIGEYVDVIKLQYFNISPPQNLSDESLKKYFDKIIGHMHDLIGKYDAIIEHYYENEPQGS